MQKFTREDLLLYVLNEVDHDTRRTIEKALRNYPELKKEVVQLRQTIDEVQQFDMQPCEKILGFILEDLHEEKKISIV